MNLRKRDSTSKYFQDLKIIKVPDLYEYAGSIFMFKYINHQLPSLFDNYFKVNNSIHSHRTRQTVYLHTPFFRSKLGTEFIRCQGVRFWTNVLKNVTWKGGIGGFKNQLKIHIMGRY